MAKTKLSTDRSSEAGDVKQHFLFWRYDIHADERNRHGNTASPTLCHDLLWPTQVQIPPPTPETCRFLQTIHRRHSGNLATSPLPKNQCAPMGRIH